MPKKVRLQIYKKTDENEEWVQYHDEEYDSETAIVNMLLEWEKTHDVLIRPNCKLLFTFGSVKLVLPGKGFRRLVCPQIKERRT